jgi:hypothetical protein
MWQEIRVLDIPVHMYETGVRVDSHESKREAHMGGEIPQAAFTRYYLNSA